MPLSVIWTFSCPNPLCKKAFVGHMDEILSKIKRHTLSCENMTEEQRIFCNLHILSNTSK